MTADTKSSTRRVRRAAEDAAAVFAGLMVEAERIGQTVAAGVHGRRRAGPGETFWQHRAYAFGDPVTAIDWRQSARAADRLYVRQNEWEAAAAVWLWRDSSRSLDYASGSNATTKRRRADILATALAILLSRAGERIGLLGRGRRPFHGRSAPSRFLEALDIDRFDDESSPPQAAVSPGARIVLISDFFVHPDRIAEAVRFYAAAGARGALLQIVDPSEEEFPFEGRIEFRDLESADRLLFGEAGSIGRAYRDAFVAHRAALQDIARRTGWTFLAHRTDKAPHGALLSLYTALSDFRMLK